MAKLDNASFARAVQDLCVRSANGPMTEVGWQTLAKEIHALCVKAGVCNHRACQGAPTVKRTSGRGRANLTVLEAKWMCRK